jgi:3-phosphoshikimate 1-carboxyvinyltransferase
LPYIIQHMRYRLKKDKKELTGRVLLPASKSISNRLLILNALSEVPGRLENLSDSDDTRVLEKALQSDVGTIDIGHAGTAMRFLTAYLSIREGDFVLTGSERMQQRPIGKLVDALNDLGARIGYLRNPGFPPLSIHGSRLAGGEISVDSSVSSQYVSALMMIGPALEKGLTLHLENETASASYIHLTRNLMLELGIPVRFAGKTVEIPHTRFKGKDMRVEGDWSAASYWYAIAALAGGGAGLEIVGLYKNSYQGDSVLPEMFGRMGVRTTFTAGGILLTSIPINLKKFEYDFSDNPDLVQTMVVLCSLLNLPFRITGTRTLKIKETDRILALQAEMKKLGILLEADKQGTRISWDGESRTDMTRTMQIKTYQDHRMAMSFSPAAILHPGLTIEDPEVVNKSYQGFWTDLQRAGFAIEELA